MGFHKHFRTSTTHHLVLPRNSLTLFYSLRNLSIWTTLQASWVKHRLWIHLGQAHVGQKLQLVGIRSQSPQSKQDSIQELKKMGNLPWGLIILSHTLRSEELHGHWPQIVLASFHFCSALSSAKAFKAILWIKSNIPGRHPGPTTPWPKKFATAPWHDTLDSTLDNTLAPGHPGPNIRNFGPGHREVRTPIAWQLGKNIKKQNETL